MSESVGAGGSVGESGAPTRPEKSNLLVRIVTAALLGPLVLLLLFQGPEWAWAIFIALSSAQVTREMLTMTHPADRVSQFIGACTALVLSVAVALWPSDPRYLLTAVMVALVLGAMLPLVRLGEISTAALRMLGTIGAPLYVGLLLSSLVLLRNTGEAGPAYVLFALLIAWLGDTGGYVFGRLMGKTKLYEAVSPKKTREGLLGSVLFATGGSAVASWTYLPQIPVVHAALLGLVGATLGMMGDLVESLLKRSTGVKDSGALLPGHGGLFDRVDALLIVGPLVYLYHLWTA